MGPPSLLSLCIITLLPYADCLDVLYPRRLYLRSRSLLEELIDPDDETAIDPRLWAVLNQIFDGLPEELSSTLEVDLADSRIGLLQDIKTTPSFELLTVVELPGCRHLTDDVVTKVFRRMHSLAAIDASDTKVSAYSIQSLAYALEDDERGPWKLSVLFLRNCKSITDEIYPHLTRFPLLSIVDLSGTLCSRMYNSPFKLSKDDWLFHKATILSSIYKSKFSTLHITSFSTPTQIPVTFQFEEELTPIPAQIARVLAQPTSTSSFYQSLPKPIPTNLRLVRQPPTDPHVTLRTAQSLHAQLRSQNRALRSTKVGGDPSLPAEVNWSSERAKRAKMALDDVFKGRVDSMCPTVPIESTSEPSREKAMSKNPFRRRVESVAEGGATLKVLPLRREATIPPSSRPPLKKPQTQDTTSTRKHTPTTATPSIHIHASTSESSSTRIPLNKVDPKLKPISSFKPPPFPVRTSILTSTSERKTSLPFPTTTVHNPIPNHGKRPCAMLDTKGDENNGPTTTKARRSPSLCATTPSDRGSSIVKLAPSNNTRIKPKPNLKGKLQTQTPRRSFDWKAWSETGGHDPTG